MHIPKLILSPMAGITDAPTRFIAIKNGADSGVSEMVTSQSQLWDTDKSKWRLKHAENETIKVIQIAGAEPQIVARAAIHAQQQGATAVEINMGCPAKKVCNVLAGSALLKNEALVEEIIKAAVSAVNIPVYLKTRLGWDQEHKNITKIAEIAENYGIKQLTVHGRTREQLYTGNASYELIRQIKQERSIPIYANGDITTPEKALQVLEYTGCDGLYIGRGALGQPWLFQQIHDYLLNGSYQSLTDKDLLKATIFEHIELIHQHYGDYMGTRIARKHVKWYLQFNAKYISGGFNQFAALDDPNAQLEYLLKL